VSIQGNQQDRILVTGGNGFLGSEILRQMITQNLSVRASDRGKSSRLSGVEYCRADIVESESLSPLFEGVNAVVHAAGLAHVFGRSGAKAAQFRAVNELGTANVVREAVKARVGHFILISSVSVYGDGTAKSGEDSACHPNGPYAESKWAAEQRATEIAKNGNMRLTILRLATLYGEGDPGNVARLMRTIDRNRFAWVGNGSNQKSLIYRGDAARACLIALRSSGSGINVYNISASPVAMSEVIEGLASALNRRAPRWRIPASLAVSLSSIFARLVGGRGRLGTLKLTLQKWLADDVYDASKFRDATGFETEIDLAEGLRREVDWYRQEQSR